MALAQMVINTIQAHRHGYPVEKPRCANGR